MSGLRPVLKGVPIPASRPPVVKTDEFVGMEVGDAKDFRCGYAERHTWKSLAHIYGKKTGKKFLTRTLTTGGRQFLRIWRTE